MPVRFVTQISRAQPLLDVQYLRKNIYKIRDHVFGDKLNNVTTQIGAGAATGVAISEAEI